MPRRLHPSLPVTLSCIDASISPCMPTRVTKYSHINTQPCWNHQYAHRCGLTRLMIRLRYPTASILCILSMELRAELWASRRLLVYPSSTMVELRKLTARCCSSTVTYRVCAYSYCVSQSIPFTSELSRACSRHVLYKHSYLTA